MVSRRRRRGGGGEEEEKKLLTYHETILDKKLLLSFEIEWVEFPSFLFRIICKSYVHVRNTSI